MNHRASKILHLAIVGSMLLMTTHSTPTFLTARKVNKRSVSDQISVTQHFVSEGHNIELECEAVGPSPPVIHWLFNGSHVNQGPLDHISENVMAPVIPGGRVAGSSWGHEYKSIATLLIKHASSKVHSGEYTCVADLPGKRTTLIYNVVVRPPLQRTLERLLQPEKRSEPRGEETRIYLYTDSVYEFEGVSTLLMCRATQGPDKPTPAIHWSIEDVPITAETPGFNVESNGDLKILETSEPLHLALIKCTAVGEAGDSDEREPFIYLFEPLPEPAQ